jgi:hypothetical protein
MGNALAHDPNLVCELADPLAEAADLLRRLGQVL